jgi:hypothetical protein
MKYIISSPSNTEFEKLIAYAQTLGIAISPIPDEEKQVEKTFSFAQLRINLSDEANKLIDNELKETREAWEQPI